MYVMKFSNLLRRGHVTIGLVHRNGCHWRLLLPAYCDATGLLHVLEEEPLQVLLEPISSHVDRQRDCFDVSYYSIRYNIIIKICYSFSGTGGIQLF